MPFNASGQRCFMTIALLVIQANVFGCDDGFDRMTQQVDHQKSRDTGADAEAIYPISPRVQVRYETSDPLTPQSIRAEVFNAVAYARYAVAFLGRPELLSETDAYTIAMGLAEAAALGNISPNEAAQLLNVEASEDDVAVLSHTIRHHARGIPTDKPANQSTWKVAHGMTRLAACQGDGHTLVDCCRALAWGTILRGAQPWMHSHAGTTDESYSTLTHRLLVAANGQSTTTRMQPFNQAETKAWLTYCGRSLDGAPPTINALKARYGDFHTDWTTEFHPLSRAKQAGRRIYRDRRADDTWIAIAESTDEACRVRETEVIIREPGQATRFLVFDEQGHRIDHAYFPTPRPNVDTVRFAPDVCMSCHYTLDSRSFDVVAPSYEALNLRYFSADGTPVWRNDVHCTQGQETVILHGDQPK
ncbi:MAG: hypothetical protein VX589_12735 [Myxococcota bacterium]|nr:hypothetical protein [Myxococcota bacterium]